MNSRKGAETTSRDTRTFGIPARGESQHAMARALQHGHRTGALGGVRFALEHGGVL